MASPRANGLALSGAIPGNTTAEINVPVAGGYSVGFLGNRRDVKYERTTGGSATYTVNSGRFAFVVSR